MSQKSIHLTNASRRGSCFTIHVSRHAAIMLLCLTGCLRAHATIITNAWVPIFTGVDYTTAEADTNEVRQQKVVALRIDTLNTNVSFFSTPRGGPMETIGQTTTTFVNTYKVAAGVNANFFSPVSTIPNDPRDLSGLAICTNDIVSPFESGRPSMIITRSNQASIITSALANYNNVWTAVSGSDRVLINGVAQLQSCTTDFCNQNPRTALGISSSGRFLYMMVIDGRQPGWSDGATLYEAGQWLQRLGAWNGLNLDGGGSSAMAKLEDGAAVLLNKPSGGVQRVDGNNIGIFAPPLAPVFLTQPQNQTVPIGASTAFTVSAGGTTSLHYQWQFNGTNIASATRTSLTLSNLAVTNSGNYAVVITNIAGARTSSNALLTVFRPFDITSVVIQPRPSSAVITWQTMPAATSQLEYGIAPGYGSFSPLDATPRSNHTALLIGLLPNTSYLFRILSQVDEDQFVSDQYTFSTDPNLIVDNPQATYSGVWTSGTSSPDKYGTYYQYATVTANAFPTAQATYTPTILTPGKYDVAIWYPEGVNRTTNAQVSVFFDGGVAHANVNQQTGGGAWRKLASPVDCVPGTGSFAVIANNTGEPTGVVMADAMRWTYASSQDNPTDGTVPAWWSDYYFGGSINASLDPDGDGYSTFAEYVLGTDPTNANSHLTFEVQNSPNGFTATFSPWQGGRIYELQSSASPAGGWTTQPFSPAVTNGVGSFSVTNAGQAGGQFYRLSVRLAP